MRIWLLLVLVVMVGAAAPARAEDDAIRTMSVIEWLNLEVRQSDLVVLGQVQSTAYPQPQTGRVRAVLKVGEIFHGPKVPAMVQVALKPGFRGDKYVVPTALLKDQWALLFLRNEGGRWVAPPVGRVVETPYQGLTFYPAYNAVLSDASQGISWDYVLSSLRQIIATRRQIIDGYMPSLRSATTQEERDRLKLNLEWQVKEQLGLPLP